jgi:phosphatidylinositol alpha-mannosyltransferase
VTGQLRIGLVYDDSLDRPSGVAQYVTQVGRSLQERGHEVEYLVGESHLPTLGGVPVRSLARNVGVRFNGNAASMPLYARGRALRHALAHGRFDVLHVQLPYSPVMAGRLIRLADSGTAVVGTFHIASERPIARCGARILRALCAQTLPRLDDVMCVSRTAQRYAEQTFDVSGSRVVPHMVDLAGHRFGRSDAPDGGPTRIVFVGSLVRRKGILGLVKAVGLLRREQVDVVLDIAGDGHLRGRLERLVQREGLHEGVRILGPVSEGEKWHLLASADIACFPSRFGESSGVVLLEGMAAGSGVVVGGDNPGYRELLRGNRDALVDPDHPATLSRDLARLCADPSLRRRLRDWQARLVDSHDATRIIELILESYARALRAREASSTHTPNALDPA